MTDRQFFVVWREALNSPDKSAFASDWALSNIWDADTTDDISERLYQLGAIWDVAHMSMRQIRAASGLSQAKFAERFCIPRRTIEDWDAGKRVPPDYVRLLIANQIGLI